MRLMVMAKRFSQRLIIRQMLRMLPSLSMENMCKIIDLGEKLIVKEEYREIAEALKRYIREGHPAVKIIEHVLYRLNSESRFRTIYNLFILALLAGTSNREFLQREKGFKPPLFFVISPTMRCNLKCPGCYSAEYEQDFGLSYEVLDRIFTEAVSYSIHFITISGGEPFFRKDLYDLYAKHRDIVFQVYTNGTLIDEEVADRLAKLGNVAPMLSLEGFEEETDARRGKGYFKKAMEVMDLLRERGILFGASICQTRQNADAISSEAFADMLVEKGALVAWYFQYIPIGRQPEMETMMLPEQRDMVRRRLRHIRNTRPIFICDFWNDGPYIDGCLAAGREYLHINANGDVEPCVFTHFAVDNIKDKSLFEVLNSEFFKEIRSRQPFGDNPLTPCMIIDHPENLREVVKKYSARATHPGAEGLITDLAPLMDDYARRYAEIASESWEREYAQDLSKAGAKG